MGTYKSEGIAPAALINIWEPLPDLYFRPNEWGCAILERRRHRERKSEGEREGESEGGSGRERERERARA